MLKTDRFIKTKKPSKGGFYIRRIAALLAIWASHKIATGYGVISNQVQKEDDIDRPMLPFSI
ncbi:hypothetical protein B9T24_13965 [Acinetobacter sp. ANC 4654]|nr:hypothetical protein B9T24_13965 [Acinetobacter sp. ANC 4654]